MYGLLFDLDGVITDTAEFHYEAWKHLAEKLGISIDRKFNEQLKGVSRGDSLDRILKHGGKAEAYSQDEINSFLVEKNTMYLELLESLTPKDILPGVVTLLEDAKNKGYKIALASASLNAPLILKKLGIAEMFDAIVDPSTLHKGKPDPEIFIRAAESINIPKEKSIGFEDAQAGVDALRAADIFTVGVIAEEALEGTDISVKSLEDITLNELIEKLESK